MNCPGCGATYDSSFQFCPHCGRAKLEAVVMRVEVDGGKYELCEIHLEIVRHVGFFSRGAYRLVAKAIGPSGQYIAGTSPEYHQAASSREFMRAFMSLSPSDEFYQQEEVARKVLIKQLIEDGWEYVGKKPLSGEDGQMFKRRVKQ